MAELQSKRHKAVLLMWLALWPLAAAAIFFPIRFNSLRLLIVFCLLLLWGGALLLLGNKKPARLIYLAAALVTGGFLAAPGRSLNTTALRREYARSLRGYEGARYVWGGETALGIDCSGLPRCALMKANWRQGILTANPRLIRESIALWWFDSSAHALMDGYRDKTRLLVVTPSLNKFDYARLLPGDFAVTAGGAHALVYLGEKTWIEADPGPARRVVTLQVPGHSAWLQMPAHIMRWRQFDVSR